MPSSVIEWHETATEVTFDHNNEEHVVSLTPYLRRPGDAVAVVYEIQNESVLAEESRWLVQTAGEKVYMVHEGIIHHADVLSGEDNEVVLLAESPKVHVKIAAELLSPGTAVHSNKIDVSPTGGGEVNGWINRTATLEGEDDYGDVDTVILLTRQYSLAGGDSSYGLRGLGFTVTKKWKSVYHTCNKLYTIKAPAGQYQIYVEGKASPFSYDTKVWELGYFKSGYGLSGILNYVDESPGFADEWEYRTPSAVVPSGSEGMFSVQYANQNVVGVLFYHGSRAVGSEDVSGIVPSVDLYNSADPVKLDSQGRYEYSATSGFDPQAMMLAYVWEPAVWPALSSGLVEVVADVVAARLEQMWLYPSLSDAIIEVVAGVVSPRLLSTNQCDWFDAEAGTSWRSAHGGRTFSTPASGGWRTRKPCG